MFVVMDLTFLSYINPAVFIYVTTFVAVLARRLFPTSKDFQQGLKVLLFAIPVVIILSTFSSYPKDFYYPLVLQRDWFTSILFGQVSQTSIAMVIALLLTMILTAVDSIRAPFLICARSVLHIGAAVGVVFAGDIMAQLFYCEIVALISISVVLADKRVSSIKVRSYAVVHVLAGVLLLCGLIAIITTPVSINPETGFDIFTHFSILLIISSLVMIMGVPPFNFLLVDVYGDTDIKNVPLLAALLSKVVPYVALPLMQYMPMQAMLLLGSMLLGVVLVRSVFEKSLIKTFLLSALLHSALVLFVFGFGSVHAEGALSMYLAVNLVCTFYIFLTLKYVCRIVPEVKHDITKLYKLRWVRTLKSFSIQLFFCINIILLFGLPGSIIHFAEFVLSYNVRGAPDVHYIIMLIQFVTNIIGFKVLFAYLGVWSGGERRQTGYHIPMSYFKLSIFILVGLLCATGGIVVRCKFADIVSLVSFNSLYPNAIIEYIVVLALAFVLSFVFFIKFTPRYDTSAFAFAVWKTGAKVIQFLYQVISRLLSFLRVSLENVLIFIHKVARVVLRKSTTGVFSSLYSTETVLCIMVLVLFAMFMLCLFMDNLS